MRKGPAATSPFAAESDTEPDPNDHLLPEILGPDVLECDEDTEVRRSTSPRRDVKRVKLSLVASSMLDSLWDTVDDEPSSDE